MVSSLVKIQSVLHKKPLDKSQPARKVESDSLGGASGFWFGL